MKKDSPNAFPTNENYLYEVMTLRDYFAAKAMQGIISNSGAQLSYPKDAELVSEIAYNIANTMLKQREI